MIPWHTIESITNGRLGRTMAVCPLCSEQRRTAKSRHAKVLAVTLVESEYAIYYCNHCSANGYVRPAAQSFRTPAREELQRQREKADAFALEEKKRRTQQALKLWDEAQPFEGSLAELYLRETRKIGDWLGTFASSLDQVFAFHPYCPFGGDRHPCLLALVRDIKTDTPLAIHRTALTKDGKKVDRMSFGPVGGGAIKISPDVEVHEGLMIGEGIETVLSASKHYQFKPIWSLIDAGNLSKFPVLSGIECLTIAVDNDPAGIQAAEQCARRLVESAIEVVTTRTEGVNDFNDLITGRAMQPGNLNPGIHEDEGTEVIYFKPLLNGGVQRPIEQDYRSQYLESARPLIHYEDFGKQINIDWLIKDVYALGHTSNTFGPPGGGKSALISSAAVHIGAQPEQWMGFPVKRRAGSVIFALERGALTQKRIWAESLRDNFGRVPIVVSPGMLDLMAPACVKAIVGTILRAEDDLGLPVEFISIDTISKGIACGGGEENAAKDQNRAYGHLRNVHEAMARWHPLHIATVGHTGKDESRGQRGSNAAEGDNDVQFQVAQNGAVRSVAIFKANEMPEGDLLSFEMAPFVTDRLDSDDIPIEIWIAAKCQQRVAKNASAKLSASQQTMFTILHNAGGQGLSITEWNEKAQEIELFKAKLPARTYDIREALRSKRLVREYGGRWYVDHKSE